jgi:hypothetical protein
MEIVPRFLIYEKHLFSIIGIAYCNIKINIILQGRTGRAFRGVGARSRPGLPKSGYLSPAQNARQGGSPGQTSGAPAGAAAPGEDQEDDRRKSVRGGESDAAHAMRSQVRRRGLVAKPCVPDALSFQSWAVAAIGKTTYGRLDQAAACDRRSQSSRPMRPRRASPSGTSEVSSTWPPQYRAFGSLTTSRGSRTALR